MGWRLAVIAAMYQIKSNRTSGFAGQGQYPVGFRVASPYPASRLPALDPLALAIASGVLGVAGWRRLR